MDSDSLPFETVDLDEEPLEEPYIVESDESEDQNDSEEEKNIRPLVKPKRQCAMPSRKHSDDDSDFELDNTHYNNWTPSEDDEEEEEEVYSVPLTKKARKTKGVVRKPRKNQPSSVNRSNLAPTAVSNSSKINTSKDKIAYGATQKCLGGRKCKKIVQIRSSLFCSTKCIESYAEEMIRMNRMDSTRLYGEKGTDLAKGHKFMLMEQCSGIMLSQHLWPTEENLLEFLIAYPTYLVIRQKLDQTTLKTQETKKKKKVDVKSKESSIHPCRMNVRKMLKDIVEKRVKEDTNLFLTHRDILHHVNSLESAIFKHYNNETGVPYMAKARLIGSHLEFPDNRGFYRSLLMGELRPEQILKMSSDEMSSIKDVSLLNKSQTNKIKIHEDPIENATDQRPVYSVTNQPFQLFVTKDTTALHDQHLYDVNCKICSSSKKKEMDEEKNEIEESLKESVDTPSQSQLPEEQPSKPVDSSANNSKRRVTFGSVTESQFTKSEIETLTSPTDAPHPHETPKKKVTRTSLWEGNMIMHDVGTLKCQALPVSGALQMKESLAYSSGPTCIDIPATLEIVGRTDINVMLEYINKMKAIPSKEMVIAEMRPHNPSDLPLYRNFFDYFNSRRRVGVVGNNPSHVKDVFLFPLPADRSVPSALLPFDGPGLESQRGHLMIAVIIRNRVSQQPTFKGASPDNLGKQTPQTASSSLASKACGSKAFVAASPPPSPPNIPESFQEPMTSTQEAPMDLCCSDEDDNVNDIDSLINTSMIPPSPPLPTVARTAPSTGNGNTEDVDERMLMPSASFSSADFFGAVSTHESVSLCMQSDSLSEDIPFLGDASSSALNNHGGIFLCTENDPHWLGVGNAEDLPKDTTHIAAAAASLPPHVSVFLPSTTKEDQDKGSKKFSVFNYDEFLEKDHVRTDEADTGKQSVFEIWTPEAVSSQDGFRPTTSGGFVPDNENEFYANSSAESYTAGPGDFPRVENSGFRQGRPYLPSTAPSLGAMPPHHPRLVARYPHRPPMMRPGKVRQFYRSSGPVNAPYYPHPHPIPNRHSFSHRAWPYPHRPPFPYN